MYLYILFEKYEYKLVSIKVKCINNFEILALLSMIS